MERRKQYIILIIFAFIGFSILLYPLASNKWNAYRDNRLLTEYAKQTESFTEHNWEELRAEARTYNRSLMDEEVPDAFSIREDLKDTTYEAILNPLGNELMGYVEVPKIDITIPIYHYTTPEVLQIGAGHLFGSSLPIGGDSTHTVLSAHRGLPGAKLFTDLNLLEIGDYFYLHILNDILAYEVEDIQVVEPTQTESLEIVPGEDLATLVTCTPYAVNTHRLLVRGHRVNLPEDQVEQIIENSTKKSNRMLLWMDVFCILLGCIFAGYIVFFYIKRQWKKLHADRTAFVKGQSDPIDGADSIDEADAIDG